MTSLIVYRCWHLFHLPPTLTLAVRFSIMPPHGMSSLIQISTPNTLRSWERYRRALLLDLRMFYITPHRHPTGYGGAMRLIRWVRHSASPWNHQRFLTLPHNVHCTSVKRYDPGRTDLCTVSWVSSPSSGISQPSPPKRHERRLPQSFTLLQR